MLSYFVEKNTKGENLLEFCKICQQIASSCCVFRQGGIRQKLWFWKLHVSCWVKSGLGLRSGFQYFFYGYWMWLIH